MQEIKKNQKKMKKKSNFVKEYECEGSDPDVYLNMLPPGYRFCPTDEELIIYYLKPKNLKQTLPLNKFRIADIWRYKPQHLIERFKFHREKEWYLFVKRDNWCPKGSGPDRSAGFDGYWMVTEADKDIYSGDQKIGYKTELVFHEKMPGHGDGQRTNWIMHEYKVDKESSPSAIAAADDIEGDPSTISAAADDIKGDPSTISAAADYIKGDPSTISAAAYDIKVNDWFLCKILTTEEKENNRQPSKEAATEIDKKSKNSDCILHAYKENDRNIPYDYLNSFPPGYRFCPTDEELIVHYLRPKKVGENLFVNKIQNVDVYSCGPDLLTGKYERGEENEWYFFSQLKSGPGERVNRSTGDGHWKATGNNKAIYIGDEQIGSKTTLVFHMESSSHSIKTEWIMHEYKVVQTDLLVLCVIPNTPPDTRIRIQEPKMYLEPPPKRQRHAMTSGKDRITELPDGIIHEILSNLPTKNAVATSILSKRWKDLWTYCSNLDFSDAHLLNREWSDDDATMACFINFVNNVIASNESPCINKLRFHCTADYESHVTRWVDSILSRNPNVIEIDLDALSESEFPVTLPQTLFTCQNLVFLNIVSHAIYDIPPSLHLPCLKVFRVNLYNPSDVVTTRLFCDLPALEDLSVSIWLDGDEELRLNIIIPSLKKLTMKLTNEWAINDEFDLSDYEIVIRAPWLIQIDISDVFLANYLFEEFPLVVQARLGLGRCCQAFDDDQLAARAINVINQLSGVEQLSLSSYTLGTLDFYNQPGVAIFPNLIYLEVEVTDCCGWTYLVYLLDRLPNLKSLVLKMVPAHNDSTISMLREPLQQVPQCLRLHLERLEVRGFEGQEYGLILLQYFLIFADVLGEVVVCTRNMALEERENLVKKLLKFSRGNCQLKIV